MIKRLIIIGFLQSFPMLVLSQEIRFGFSNVNERKFNISEISTQDGLVIWEGNMAPTATEAIYLGYGYSFSSRFNANIGFQYTYNFISLIVEVPLPEFILDPYVVKVQGVNNTNFEFPLEVSYDLFETGRLKWKLRAGLVPVWSSSKSSRLEEVPEGLDWSQEVVDALNAAETIPRSFYMNYQYGFGLGYGRFELSVFQSANLSNSISNGYTLNGTTYPFDRRIRSTRIGLYYSFGLNKKNKE